MKKIFTFGVFDYFHLGHLRLFKQAREHGDYLTVAVQDDECVKIYKPVQKLLYTTEERVELVQAIRFVDSVVIYQHMNAETIVIKILVNIALIDSPSVLATLFAPKKPKNVLSGE